MTKNQKDVAESLLKVGAVKLNVAKPFTFVSGIKSPIYCDNRQMIGYPKERKVIIDGFAKILKRKSYDVLAGTATAGIPWAGFLSERLEAPMAYIRSAKKDHGAGKQIEGADLKGKKVIVIEDLISTGGSCIKAVEAAREAGAKEVEVIAIFSYEFESAIENFKKANIKWETLSNFTSLIEVALEKDYLKKEEREIALKWNINPNSWGK